MDSESLFYSADGYCKKAEKTVQERREGIGMFKSDVFDYINVLDRAADASWTRHELISHNIANDDTPGYKRQDINFERELRRALGNSRYQTMDEKVRNLRSGELEGRVYTDGRNYSYRYDGNNVDIDAENTYLAENQITYNALMTSIKQEFSDLKAVIK